MFNRNLEHLVVVLFMVEMGQRLWHREDQGRRGRLQYLINGLSFGIWARPEIFDLLNIDEWSFIDEGLARRNLWIDPTYRVVRIVSSPGDNFLLEVH